MSTNNICFYEENQKKYALESLNMPLMKFSDDLSLCNHISRLFYKVFVVILKNLSAVIRVNTVINFRFEKGIVKQVPSLADFQSYYIPPPWGWGGGGAGGGSYCF